MRRLIIVEGLPCSGKSTTAKRIADALGMRFVDEGTGDHPADYEAHAFLREAQLNAFSDDERAWIGKAARSKMDGFVVPLAGCPDALLPRLLPCKIYDGLPWKTEWPLMLEKWRYFVRETDPQERFVFNCVLLQNPMCETMMRFGFPLSESAAYIRKICRVIRPMEPFVVYLRNTEIRKSVARALPERGQDWLDAVIAYHCGGAYGRQAGLRGFDGYIAALEERQRRETALLPQLGIDHMILENPQRNWESAYRRILDTVQ